MINPKDIDDLTHKILGAMPQGVRQIQEDVEKNVRMGVQMVLEKMDLVTREEFDVQKAVLERTREKVDRLETQVRELEARLLKQD